MEAEAREASRGSAADRPQSPALPTGRLSRRGSGGAGGGGLGLRGGFRLRRGDSAGKDDGVGTLSRARSLKEMVLRPRSASVNKAGAGSRMPSGLKMDGKKRASSWSCLGGGASGVDRGSATPTRWAEAGDELVLELLSFLNAKEVAILAMTCTRFREEGVLEPHIRQQLRRYDCWAPRGIPQSEFGRYLRRIFACQLVLRNGASLACGRAHQIVLRRDTVTNHRDEERRARRSSAPPPFQHRRAQYQGVRTGDLICRGENDSGQLGLGTSQVRQVAVAFEGLGLLWHERTAQVACGDEHTAVLTMRGCLYTFGRGEEGQLGHKTMHSLFVPKPVRYFDHCHGHVVQVSCGASHTAVVMSTGDLFSFGSTSCGKLGLGSQVLAQTLTSSPQQVHGIKGGVAHVACGQGHTLAVTLRGRVYGFGRASDGQLGFPASQDQHEPRKVRGLKGAAEASCGDRHSAVRTQSGELFTFGDATCGRLGHSALPPYECVHTPTTIDFVSKVPLRSVRCGGRYTATLGQDGLVHVFGDLTTSKTRSSTVLFHSPKLVDSLQGKAITEIAAAKDFLLLASSASGAVYEVGARPSLLDARRVF